MTIIRRFVDTMVIGAAVLLAHSLYSCSNAEGADGSASDSQPDNYICLSVSVNGESSTRAGNPDGGADGDGREDGINNENKVYNATLFLIKSNDENLSSGAAPVNNGFSSNDLDATIVDAYYFDKFTSESESSSDKIDVVYTSDKQKCNKSFSTTENYYTLVVTNMGNLLSYKDKTLQTLLVDKYATEVCEENGNISQCDKFAMSSTDVVVLSTSSSTDKSLGSYDNPFVVTANVERLAARIDFDTTNGTELSDGSTTSYLYNNVYSSTDATTESGEVFVLESVTPFNLPNATMGEMLFKAVSSTESTALSAYVKQETYDTSDKTAKNYVLDRAQATGTTKAASLYSTAGSTTSSSFPSTSIVSLDKIDNTNNNKVYILKYSMENVPVDNSTTYTTGLTFSGKLYKADEWDKTNNKPKEEATGTSKSYTYYIRHCNPNDKETAEGKMYYGIVRNNIYRVKIGKVINSQEEGLKLSLILKVKPWTVYEHNTIEM